MSPGAGEAFAGVDPPLSLPESTMPVCTVRRLTAATLAAAALTVVLPAVSTNTLAAQVGAPAPAFELTDSTGKSVKLSDFKGRHVVLE